MERWTRRITRSICGLVLLASVTFPSVSASQTVNLPHVVDDEPLTTIGQTYEVLVNTLTLPVRPRIRAIATPDAAHPDMVLDVEVLGCDQYEFYNDFELCPGFGTPCVCEDYYDWNSAQDPGEAIAVGDVFECLPFPLEGDPSFPDQCTVAVTLVSFGPAGAPGTIDLVITAEEGVLTGSESVSVDTSFDPPAVSVVLEASKDATIYEDSGSGINSNGAGQLLRSGRQLTNPFAGFRHLRRTLIAFDLVDSLGDPIPPGSTFTSAELTLNVLGIPAVTVGASLWRLDPRLDWGEGLTDPPGGEGSGLPAQPGDATWTHYQFSSNSVGQWADGGALLSPSSAFVNIFGTGPATWDGPGLLADLEAMVLPDDVDSGVSQNQGWAVVASDSFNEVTTFSFDSRESLTPANRPSLAVTYQEYPTGAADLTIERRLNFIADADNFRWIYDDDGDNLVQTAVQAQTGLPQGECLLLDPNDQNAPPFLYTYLGEPDVVGHDCCTWQADTLGNGTGNVVSTGVGQAVIHLNQSTSVPVPDFDSDGIGDPCDNCFWTPNGPDRGSCSPDDGSEGDGETQCLSDLECGSGQICNLAQEDDDLDGVGTACPEPSTTLALSIGLLGLAGLPRRRSRRLLRV